MSAKILIIDDEPEIRELYRNFLETEDYQIKEAQNGQEAFKMAAEDQFDLFITDIMMPEMNGVEFMKVLKMIDPDAIVIIVTGFDDMEYTREALNYGAFRFLTKPINMKEFLQVVEMGLMERKQLFRTTTPEKLNRLKDKLNTNPDLQEKVFQKLETFLLQMEHDRATYIEMGGPGSKGKIWAKIQSDFRPIEVDRGFNQDEINIMILSILGKKELDTLLETKFLKFNHEFTKEAVLYRYRVKAYFEMNELVVGIKPTRRKIQDLDTLGLSQNFLGKVSFRNENSGLVIFSGPTGSGKSSVIDSIVDFNNRTAKGSIYVIADSLEFYHESNQSIIRQQEIQSDVNSLLQALDNCLDFNPDLVVIEELYSPEVVEACFRLVESGSLVFATLRNKSTIDAIYKVLNIFTTSEHERIRKNLSTCLNAVISMQLVPSTRNDMVMVKEILVNTPQVSQSLVNDNIDNIYPMLLQGKQQGMITMEQDLHNMVKKSLIRPETALEYANNLPQLQDLMKYR